MTKGVFANLQYRKESQNSQHAELSWLRVTFAAIFQAVDAKKKKHTLIRKEPSGS